MSESRDGRLLTGAYGVWQGERHTLLGPEPDGGRLWLLRWSFDPLPSPWKSAQLGEGSAIRFRNQLSVESNEVSDIFTIQVVGRWRQCEVIISGETEDESWEVQFASARDAWAHHAHDQPGIDGDPYDRVWGTLPKTDVEAVVSLIQRYEDSKMTGSPEERWEYGPLA